MAYKYKKSGDVVHYNCKAYNGKTLVRMFNADSLTEARREASWSLQKGNADRVVLKNNHSKKSRTYTAKDFPANKSY